MGAHSAPRGPAKRLGWAVASCAGSGSAFAHGGEALEAPRARAAQTGAICTRKSRGARAEAHWSRLVP